MAFQQMRGGGILPHEAPPKHPLINWSGVERGGVEGAGRELTRALSRGYGERILEPKEKGEK